MAEVEDGGGVSDEVGVVYPTSLGVRVVQFGLFPAWALVALYGLLGAGAPGPSSPLALLVLLPVVAAVGGVLLLPTSVVVDENGLWFHALARTVVIVWADLSAVQAVRQPLIRPFGPGPMDAWAAFTPWLTWRRHSGGAVYTPRWLVDRDRLIRAVYRHQPDVFVSISSGF